MYLHAHKYKFESSISKEHKHSITGYTDYMLGIGSLHFHNFYGVCSYNGHSHYFSGITGLPIKAQNGHVHKVEGIVEINNLHRHKFCDFTFEEIGYIKQPDIFACKRLATQGR